jgi:galactose oxidase
MNGNAVMYDSGKILCVGGSKNYDGDLSKTKRDGVAKAVASIVTITAPATGNPTAVSKTVAPMHFPRAFASSVVLPDGKVVVIGGMPFPVVFKDDNAILHPGTPPAL